MIDQIGEAALTENITYSGDYSEQNSTAKLANPVRG